MHGWLRACACRRGVATATAVNGLTLVDASVQRLERPLPPARSKYAVTTALAEASSFVMTYALQCDGLDSPLRVEYTNDAHRVNAWITDNVWTPRCDVVGLDCEWRPMRRPGAPERPPAVLQLATSTSILVAHLHHLVVEHPPSATPAARHDAVDVRRPIGATNCGAPVELLRLMQDPATAAAGVAVSSDVMKMARMLSLRNEALLRAVNLEALARQIVGMTSFSLSGLASAVGFTQQWKSASAAMGDWERSRLTDHMIRYAAMDAYVSLHVYRQLQARLQQQEAAGIPPPVAPSAPTPSWSGDAFANDHRAWDYLRVPMLPTTQQVHMMEEVAVKTPVR